MMNITLRPWSVADAAQLRAAIDEDVAHLQPWMNWSREEPRTLAQTEERLREFADDFATGRSFRYAITPADNPQYILGGASLHARVGPNAFEIGYWVRRSATRKGIASAAVKRLIGEAFEMRGADRVEIQCDVANLASATVARKLGFREAEEFVGMHPDGSPRRLRRFELDRRSADRALG